MTANWFEGKVKYIRVNESGRECKVSEAYLIDAMSYTEAESRIVKEMDTVIKGDYYISSLKKSNVSEVVSSVDEHDDRWYKAKVAIVDADNISGKEKRSFIHCLVAATNTDRALENLNEFLSTFVVPTEVVCIADTQVMDVFEYQNDNGDKKYHREQAEVKRCLIK
ncbi:MAG: DUF4494 domain-containing protein [Odoribacter sp.]